MGYLTTVTNTIKSWSTVNAEMVAVGVFEDKTLTEVCQSVDKVLGGKITQAIELGDIRGKAGETNMFYTDNRRILVIGLGKKDDFDGEAVRKTSGTVVKTAISKKIANIALECFCKYASDSSCQSLTEGIILGSYQFADYKTEDDEVFFLESAVILNGNENEINQGVISANAVCYARDLGNHPGNIVTPSRLAEAAKEIASLGGMKCMILEREEFEALGMGALAGVARGSSEPPKFILLEYWGQSKDEKPIALVGKGLTFDSGGLSLKPAARMDEMKYDMCGSAVVLGAMKAVAEVKPKINIVAAIPSTENMSGAKAYKPGDILTAYNGKTIEVLNTDAEGRLILADALSYVSKHYNPAYILDFATLTGAVVVALGHYATGVLGTDAELLEKVRSASIVTGEKIWELPLWDEYCEDIKSKIADVKNVGGVRQAGTIAGGAFLKEFVEESIPWVHFDIAGTAWGTKELPYTQKNGATGVMVRLVLNLIGV